MSAPTPHPVAGLLNAEQRARVAAATFARDPGDRWFAPIMAKVDGTWRCPLGVAADLPGCPGVSDVLIALGFDWTRELHDVVMSFTALIDNDPVAPDEVYGLLGVEPVV